MDGLPPPIRSGLRTTASACLSTGGSTPSPPATNGSNSARIRDEDYQEVLRPLLPRPLRPEKWAREAKNAGMRYFVVTTKHHDGFCLWDSDLTGLQGDQHALGRGPHRPDGRGVPRRGHEGRLLPLPHRLAPSRVPGRRAALRDDTEYIEASRTATSPVTASTCGQTRELLTRFGRVDIMWFDFSYSDRVWGGKGREDWGSEELWRWSASSSRA